MVNPLQNWRSNYEKTVKTMLDSGVIGPKPLEHYLAGPVDPSEAMGLIEIPRGGIVALANDPSGPSDVSTRFPSAADVLIKLCAAAPMSVPQANRMRIKNDLFFGELMTCLALAANVAVRDPNARQAGGTPFRVKVYWGYASWNVTQLLGEIARRSWGLVVSHQDLSLEPDKWDKHLGTWKNLVDQSVVAKDSEYAVY